MFYLSTQAPFMSVNNFLILFSGNKIANFMFFLYFHSNNRLKPKITTMRNDNIGKYLNDFESLIDTPFMNLDKIVDCSLIASTTTFALKDALNVLVLFLMFIV